MKTITVLIIAISLLLAALLLGGCGTSRPLTQDQKSARLDSLYHANQIRTITDQMRGR